MHRRLSLIDIPDVMAEDTPRNKHMINTDRVFDYVNQDLSECLKAFSLGSKT